MDYPVIFWHFLVFAPIVTLLTSFIIRIARRQLFMDLKPGYLFWLSGIIALTFLLIFEILAYDFANSITTFGKLVILTIMALVSFATFGIHEVFWPNNNFLFLFNRALKIGLFVIVISHIAIESLEYLVKFIS